jgi:hypothetical protein
VSPPGHPAGYPVGAPSYPGGPASTFGTPAGPPPQAAPPSGRGGRGGHGGHRGGSRAKWSWSSWWIAPYLVGAIAVLLVFAILQVTVLSGSNGSAAAAPKPRVAAQAFPDALFTRLTKDIQTSNEKDFLSLTAASAQPAVQLWWSNMKALGFSTGLIMPTNKYDQVNLNSNGDGTTIALAGTHNGFDPVHTSQHQVDVPLEQYQIGLHFSGLKAIGQITSWKGLGNAPWDQGKLYVNKSANVIVAGPASESALVDETVPLAQTAAAYDVGLVNHVHNTDIRQSGFMVFVSNNQATRSKWFSTTKQPSGWPPFATSLTAQLPGPSASDDQNWKLGNLAQDTTGGARVVITPWEDENGANQSDETTELVTRFAQDILSSDNQSLSFLGKSTAPAIPAWAIEGFGVAFEAAYKSNTNPTPDKYSFSALTSAIKALPASEKTGTLPTAAQLYNSNDQTEQDARVLAASVYAAIATKYGMAQLLGSAGLMWTQFADPRGNVLDAANSTNDKLAFFDQPTIQSLWQEYLASPTDLAPATGPTGI